VSALAKKTTIVISCDGFRWDYAEMYDTPFLDLMARQGVKGELVPSFPSKTFPNHYTLATGLRPEHHGIIANSFLNRATGARFSLSNPKTKFDAHF
jgi:predicted AlkP superfamily pyrophosphatase or phosphodiesterase